MVAKAIHATSGRAQRPFISVNCRAMSERRFEKELFGIGHEGDEEFSSLLEQADGGTILLNDILSITPEQQVNLLRFFQEGTIETANGFKKVNVRLLAANSTDLEKALIDGDFNDELYHYINVLRINVPSLKERLTDISLLARHYLQQFSKEYNAQARGLTDDALKELSRYHWPGNVRELINQIKRMVLMSDSVMLTAESLDLPKRTEGKMSLKCIRERSEKDALVQVLESNGGQVSLAAKELDISRATMYRLLNKHGLLTDDVI
jgi:DNA-binding NtrC family response regulator